MLINTAIESGVLGRPRFVRPGLAPSERAELAATSDDWHEYWDEVTERLRAQEVYGRLYPHGYPKRDGWFGTELAERHLETQFASRARGGWNEALAAKAQAFHEESEAVAKSGKWADKAFVFYSLSEAPTTLAIHLERVSETEFPTFVALLEAEGTPLSKFQDGDIAPPRRDDELVLQDDKETRKVPATLVHQWHALPGGKFRRTVWRFYGENARHKGDRTVPDWSLKGFGGRAFLFHPIPGDQTDQDGKPDRTKGPEHTDAPNADYVWDGIMRAIQRTLREKLDGSLEMT